MGLTGRDPPACDYPAASQPARAQTIGVKSELNWASDAEMGQFSCQNCTAGQGMDTDRDESRRRGGGAGCRTLGLCLLRGSVGALFGQWTPRFLFSRSTSPLSNTTQHSKTVQSRQLPPWVSISAACFCKPQFWRWATPSASVPVF